MTQGREGRENSDTGGYTRQEKGAVAAKGWGALSAIVTSGSQDHARAKTWGQVPLPTPRAHSSFF